MGHQTLHHHGDTMIEFFEFPGMKGECASISVDTPDLSEVGFLQKAQSIRIQGEPWVVFTEPDYKGDFTIFKTGEYSSIPGFSEKICSARVVKGGLYSPEIKLYEHHYYCGRELVLTKAADALKSYAMENMISSHKVLRGAWILYDGEFYTGKKMVALAGDCQPNYYATGWNNKVNSLHFISPTMQVTYST